MPTNRKTNQRSPRDPDQRLVQFYAPSVMHDRLREIAEANHRSVAGELRSLVDRRITEVDALEQAA